MKDLIIGGFTNYEYSQLKPWVESIEESGFEGDKVLVVGSTTKETLDKLIEKKFSLVLMPDISVPIHVSRFLLIYDFLKKNHENYRYVITTDVRDVYFQSNPTIMLDEVCGKTSKYKILVGSESLRYKDESWGNQNLRETYGSYIHEEFKEKEIYNVGVIGGLAPYVKDLVLQIFINAVNRPIPIVDQAVFNFMMHTHPWSDITFKAKQEDGWACHAGTTVDPSKIDSFRPNLLEPEPLFIDGKVYTHAKKLFTIVHQYDRVPEWEKSLKEKYG